MKYFLIGFSLLFISIHSFSTPRILKGAEAENVVSNAELVRYNDRSPLPNYIQFESSKKLPESKFQSWIQQFFQGKNGLTSANINFELIKTTKDQIGYTHREYQEKINNIPVQFGRVKAHIKNGNIQSFSGELYPANNNVASPSLGEKSALNKALTYIGAKKYKWQNPAEESFLKKEQNDMQATFYPKGNLTYIYKDNQQNDQLQLAYKFNIYAAEPMSRTMVWVDAVTGDILYTEDLIMESNSTGTAQTVYSGTQTIITDKVSANQYRLKETGRANGVSVITRNLRRSKNYNYAIDFYDSDNNWNNVNSSLDQYATDAHWGAEMTIDYYYQKHNRNSIDGNGMSAFSYVHFGVNYRNAFWDGYRMTYGDGNNQYQPLVALDIAGHEMTHGVTGHSAGLTYKNEPGALNESFSDIMGNTIEHWAKPNNSSWGIGENIGAALRSMSNTKPYKKPNTYKGQYWYTGSQDNGGVHSNSSVQNYWYYLMVEGGTGTNDNNDSYNITGLGWDTAANIAYRNLTVYLSSNSQYSDARFYAIKSASDLYGGCTHAVKTTTNAWYAVGVGDQFVSQVISDFVASGATGCALPQKVSFKNKSSNGQSYYWDFGDGTHSVLPNPIHTYTSFGKFNVKLVSDGGVCGIDSTFKIDYVDVTDASPTVTDDTVCYNHSAILKVSGSGLIKWYFDPRGHILIGTGSVHKTAPLTSDSIYYVSNTINYPAHSAGPKDKNIGSGASYQFNQYLLFDVDNEMELVSVKVYAKNAVYRTIELRNNKGNVLQSKAVTIPASATSGYVVNLNFIIPPGKDYQLGVAEPQAKLYRNDGGAQYPYNMAGFGEITGNSVMNTAPNYYYLFYDWKVRKPSCTSKLKSIKAHVEICQGVDSYDLGNAISIYPNPANNELNIRLDELKKPVHVSIYNSIGQLVFNKELSHEGTYQIPTSSYSNGVYNVLFQSTDSGNTVSKKLVIAK